ncbi:MAG: acetyl-CoA C-acetyltransferase, partial [Planctomycetes bacterium]|nr:acetyl-CoA C-acetyltransferase [Planctomycetota bacterium]
GTQVTQGLLQQSDISAGAIDEIIMGQIYTGGAGVNPARQVSLNAGLHESTVATTINMVCGSGLRSVQLAAQSIQCGQSGCVIAGGMESMSNAPFVAPHMRQGHKMGNVEFIDSMVHDALWDPQYEIHMGVTAENLAEKYTISREEQDAFAAMSQQRCEQAQDKEIFKDEIHAIEIPQRRGEAHVFDRDEYPRSGVTAESLGKLKPAFQKDGTVTAGNASGLNDGAAAVMLMSEKLAQELGLQPLAFIHSTSCVGVDPRIMGIGPAPAIQKLLHNAGLSLEDIDLLEVNEAFAAQALAVKKELDWNDDVVNVNGGSIAIGHPVGASGTRILVTLLHELQRRDRKRGIASLCIGGGMGIAMMVERI